MSSKFDFFLRCLEFAILNSHYTEIVLKPKLVICLEKLFLNSDVLAVLPTGFGKSLIFHLLPALLDAKKNGFSKGSENISSIIVVVSPLNALITNQISKLNSSGIRASALDVIRLSAEPEDDDEYDCDFQLCDKVELETGHYSIVFVHPESLVSCADRRKLMHKQALPGKFCAVVVDEAHCILEW